MGQSDRPNVCLFKNRSVIKLHTAAVGQLASQPLRTSRSLAMAVFSVKSFPLSMW